MAEVDPFDIEFAEDDEKYSKPSYTGSRGTGLYKKSLKALEKERERNKIRKEYPSLTDEQADELIEMRKRNKGMLDWSEDLQRAVMAEEMKKSNPEMSDEEIQERVDYQMAGVDVEDYTMPKDNIDELFEKALRKEHPDWSEEQIQEMVNLKDEEEPVIDVPEMETEIVDLPSEDKNEKEIVIDRNPDDTVVDPDRTIAEDIEGTGEDPLKDFDPDSVVDPEGEYETRVSAEEVGDGPTQYPSDEEIAGVKKASGDKDQTIAEGDQTPDANKKEEPKKEGKEEQSVMSDEDALKEAQELAQDELLGFKISGSNWQKMSEKQKAEAIKAFKDANKKEDHSTNIDKSETNNYASYERYPTALKVAEDALGEVNTVAGGVKDVAEKVGKQGANSGSISNEVARAVPHYDYRSLFR